MLKKLVLIAVAMVVVAGFISCDILGGATGVKGKLILEPGQTGDVRNARVQLFVDENLSGTPVAFVQSESGDIDETEAEFEITDVLAGYYYLVAWKDIDGDGDISHLDLVGVYNGTYKAGEAGQQLTIEDGKMTDVGDITMMIYKEAKIESSSGTIADGGYTVSYTYTFNEDVTLDVFTVILPGYDSYVDPDEKGSRTGGQSYTTQKYIIGDGSVPIPTGTHTLNFVGEYEDADFDITVDVSL